MLVRTFCCAIAFLLVSTVSRAEEFRGAWVAAVYNLNFPSTPGLPADTQKAQIRQIVSDAARSGLNALMVQVRPEADALYSSHIEPWSRFLSGTQGMSPGYDPLQYFITEARKQGIGVHAWINPYRAASNSSAPRAANHISRELSASVHKIGTSLWLDPGDPDVRAHVISVVRDIVSRYSIAGVILDDYFYPYPSAGHARGTFPDSATYSKYGGGENLADWRRQNVNRLIEQLHGTIKSLRPNMQFGVSPFGVYTKGFPGNVTVELDQYHDLYADPVTWLKHGWVDYLSPQLYWRDKSAQSFSVLLQWWRSPTVNPREIPIYPSIALERLGGPFHWPASEIATQLSVEAVTKPRTSGGYILWNIGPLMNNTKGVARVIAGAR
jgi:uncharacterized lipoprotein YddW (UPF0748 family)